MKWNNIDAHKFFLDSTAQRYHFAHEFPLNKFSSILIPKRLISKTPLGHRFAFLSNYEFFLDSITLTTLNQNAFQHGREMSKFLHHGVKRN